MTIGLYGIEFYHNYLSYYQQIIERLNRERIPIYIYSDLYKQLSSHLKLETETKTFSNYAEVREKVNILFSIGGDGCFLSSVTFVRDSLIPILGINLGNLGFLSSIAKTEIDNAISSVIANNYILDKRTLIQLNTHENHFGDMNFALNEFTVVKKDNLSMINIHVYVNDVFLNTYWADGLIVSTPTGSTGYSLSCSGPIVAPGSKVFLLTPIATHNLTVRPVVIPDNSIIKLRVSGRNKQFLGGLDSRFETIGADTELILSKADFKVNLIQVSTSSFFNTIREKLNWGIDKRN
ncbi:MAG: NAD kinase [Bacteroidales bacterium]|nr:NAD kinase [Bacteroidales bacterium]